MSQSEREKGKGRPPRRVSEIAPKEDLFARRKRIISDLPPTDARRQPALDMCEFDRLTDPGELRREDESQAMAVERLTVHLQFRYLQRASWALHTLPFEPDHARDERAAAYVRIVEPLFREALLAVFPGPQPPRKPGKKVLGQRLDLRRFENTFAAYTVGELAMTRIDPSMHANDPLCNHGVADGANMFAFAESALLFVRQGHRRDFWRPLLPLFVAAAEHYATYYWDRVQRSCAGYRPQNLSEPAMTRKAFLAVVNQRHRALPLSALLHCHGATLAAALQQDAAISIPDCTPRELS